MINVKVSYLLVFIVKGHCYKEMSTTPAIGIDLGTTYSCVGVYLSNKVEIILNDQGFRTTPSSVAFTEVERLIGDAAENQAATNPENTIYGVKRLIGRRFDEESVQDDMKHWPFEVFNDDGKPKIRVEYKGESKNFYPEEISSMVLQKMKGMAEAYLEKTVTNAVITVPAYFNDSQRQSTKDAAKIAGLNVLRIINEPTAAAIAYGLNREDSGQKNVLIYDLGGGTFDVSILSIDKGVFVVKSTNGDTHLGGEDFVKNMVEHCAKEFKRKNKKDMSSNKKSLRQLRNQCEKAKRILSASIQTSIECPYLFEGIDFQCTLSRPRFEELNSELFQRTLIPVENALKDANLDKSKIDEIVLVGGSTRIPKIQQLIKDFFQRENLNITVNPDEAVAYGAAIEAAIRNGDNSERLRDMILQDITPLSLGIEIIGNVMCTVITRNSTIPIRRSHDFTTIRDNQSLITFPVYEGERPVSTDNNLLGKFDMTGIIPAPRGVPKIKVTFFIDENGIINVSAVDNATGNKNKITINNKDRLPKEEIERMLKDAQKYQDEDMEQRKRIAAKTSLEKFAFQIKSDVGDGKLKKNTISQTETKKLVEKCEETINWLDDNQLAEEEEFEYMKKELEKIYNSIKNKPKATIFNFFS